MIPELHGEIPFDLQGALRIAKREGMTLAAGVYEEALAGKIARGDVRAEVLVREALAEHRA